MGSGTDYRELAGESESYFLHCRGRYLFVVCGSRFGILWFVVNFLDYMVLYVCIYCVPGGMHDTELLEDRGMGETRCFVGQGQSSDNRARRARTIKAGRLFISLCGKF